MTKSSESCSTPSPRTGYNRGQIDTLKFCADDLIALYEGLDIAGPSVKVVRAMADHWRRMAEIISGIDSGE